MFRCGEYVMYSTHGACQIVAVEQRKIDRKSLEYYVLTPVNQPKSMFYVPTGNAVALSKLRAMLTLEDIHNLLQRHKNESATWNPDESKRKNLYKELLGSGDTDALFSMIASVTEHRKQMESVGKRIHSCDETFLSEAKQLMNSEFSLVLKIPPQEVEAYIENALI